MKTQFFLGMLASFFVNTQSTEAQIIASKDFYQEEISRFPPAANILQVNNQSCIGCGLASGIITLTAGIRNAKINSNTNVMMKGFGIDYFHAIKVSEQFSWGFNGGISYFAGTGDPFKGNLPNAFPVSNETSSVVVGTSNTNISEILIGAGPQINYAISDRIVVSALVHIGYFGSNEGQFDATQTTKAGTNIFGLKARRDALPEIEKSYNLLLQNETKNSGIVAIPKLRVNYMISNKIGAGLEFAAVLGAQRHSVIKLVPQQEQAVYSFEDLDNANYVSTEINTNFVKTQLSAIIVFKL